MFRDSVFEEPVPFMDAETTRPEDQFVLVVPAKRNHPVTRDSENIMIRVADLIFIRLCLPDPIVITNRLFYE